MHAHFLALSWYFPDCCKFSINCKKNLIDQTDNSTMFFRQICSSETILPTWQQQTSLKILMIVTEMRMRENQAIFKLGMSEVQIIAGIEKFRYTYKSHLKISPTCAIDNRVDRIDAKIVLISNNENTEALNSYF